MRCTVPKPLYQLCCGTLFLTICGFIGWIYETIFTSILWGHFCGFFARGLLHLPVCPIYGFFALLLLLLFRIPFLQHLSGWKKYAAVFVVGTAVCTLCELIASYLMEAVLGEFLWSYEGWPVNFQGRISLCSSLLFGALSLLLFQLVAPAFRKLSKRLPDAATAWIGGLCGAALLADLCLTLFFCQ